MSKIGLVISTEYKNKVVKKSFIILTFLMPIMFAAIILVPVWLASIEDGEEKVVAIVDNSGLYKELFADSNTDDMKIEIVGEPVEKLRDEHGEEYKAVVVITDDLSVNPDALTIYSYKQVPREIKRFVENTLSVYIEKQKLASYNIEGLEQMIKDAETDIHASTVKWGDDGKDTSSNTDVAMIVGMLTTMVIYMFIFISGAQVMSAVVQEKTNRIVEVMVCSVKPWELMWGKIIGVALVCLTQVALWIVMTLLLTVIFGGFIGLDTALAESSKMNMGVANVQNMEDVSKMTEIVSMISTVNWTELIVWFVLYFIAGYLLYASLFAAIGAAVDNESDTQQFMMPITFVVLFALYAGIYSAENPDGPLAFWCSMIPFTSPIVMMVRLPFDVPLWEMLLSYALLILTIIGTTWLSSKIYRVGILMYGKKPSWKEIWKWIRYQ